MSYDDLRATYGRLLSEGRLERRSFKQQEVAAQLDLARRDLATARELLKTDFDWAYAVAYNAVLQAARALMFAHGYRPVGPHQHVSAIQCLRAEGIDDQLLVKADRMRRKRHRVVYEQAGMISRSDAESAVRTGEQLLALIDTYLEGLARDR